ncbi:MAG TPA: glycosyltransferase family 2 protein, partial [Tabrizicola sp.]|nr:glycosyltransferase family 2 protein [Tabrizicola sp.]
ILPSIQSVLGQTLAEWELLVVGDGCTDETEAVVRGVGDSRVRWLNLADRVGSQSGPNNAGIAAARAPLIAYLGHDDIWEPDHLGRMLDVFRAGPTDFVVSGTLLHPPPGVDLIEVMGLLSEKDDLREHFLPPSSFSHRRDVTDRIGGWRKPEEIRRPVDDDLLNRAVEAGLQFRFTGAVTVHKFPAAQRYLSYLCLSSDEQEAMLRGMGQAGHGQRLAAWIDQSRAGGRYMRPAQKTFESSEPGEFHRQSIARRGARTVPVVPLGQGVILRNQIEEGSLDWKADPKLGFRRNFLNPHPRILLPVTGDQARLRFVATCRKAEALGPIALLCNGDPVVARPGRRWFGLFWFARYEALITLRHDRATVLELQLSGAQRPLGKRRLAIGPLRLSRV